MNEEEFEKQQLEQLISDLKDIDKYTSFKNGAFIYDLGKYQGSLLVNHINNLQSKIDKANELLEEILVVSDWEHKGRFRPVKGTTAQDVYKAVCMLYGILETPYRSDYGALKEDK